MPRRTLITSAALSLLNQILTEKTFANHPSDSFPPAAMDCYGQLSDGREVGIFTLENQSGMIARVSEYGATLTHLLVPDEQGNLQDLTLGYDDLGGWENDIYYFGATVGRFGNRIAKGQFTLDGTVHNLPCNNTPGGLPCHLHGGPQGFHKALWKGKSIPQGVELSLVSPDGEEGYPGDLSVTVRYLLNDDNELVWTAEATTTKATPVNIIQHSYWNLSGHPTCPINDHWLQLPANHFLPTNAGLIPTGELRPVTDTPMDFRQALAIGERIEADYESLQFGNGYDHAWVLSSEVDGSGLRPAALLTDPSTGRSLEVLTDQPAIQFYAGNFLDGKIAGKGAVPYQKRTGLCLETEQFPDSPNQPSFPNPILHPGETYRHTLVFRFKW